MPTSGPIPSLQLLTVSPNVCEVSRVGLDETPSKGARVTAKTHDQLGLVPKQGPILQLHSAVLGQLRAPVHGIPDDAEDGSWWEDRYGEKFEVFKGTKYHRVLTNPKRQIWEWDWVEFGPFTPSEEPT